MFIDALERPSGRHNDRYSASAHALRLPGSTCVANDRKYLLRFVAMRVCWNGRQRGLKSLGTSGSVWVRIPPPAQCDQHRLYFEWLHGHAPDSAVRICRPWNYAVWSGVAASLPVAAVSRTSGPSANNVDGGFTDWARHAAGGIPKSARYTSPI